MNLNLAIGMAGIPQAANGPASPSEQLDKLLAPVALYPDALLMQVLAISVNSQEVLDAGNWLLLNKSLQGDALDTASKSAGFGPAAMALMHFPQVLDMLCSELDWTKQLGEAFTANQSAVLDSVQRLRLQAQQVGNLKTTPQQTVVTQQASGQQVIVIQPTNPQVIYVPQYNPVIVYTTPPAPPGSSVSTESAMAAALIAFGVGMAVGSMFNNNHYYYPRWGYGGGVYYRGGVWVSTTYIYRPVYHGSYHRATLYYRPPNYPYAYNRPYPNYAHYNSNSYYNNYRGNTNNQNKSNNTINRNVSGNNVTINTGNQVNKQGDKTRNSAVNNGNTQTNPAWKGQSTYAGGTRNSANTSNTASTMNPKASTPNRAAGQPVKPDRGYSSGAGATPPARSNPQPVPATRSAGAFEGSKNSGKAERTSGQRGAASTQGRRP